MPFVRLLAIYVLVGAAIFAFLKRDRLIAYFASPEMEISTPVQKDTPEPPPAKTQEPAATATANDAVVPDTENPSSYSAPSVFGSDITPQYFGQTAASAAARPPTAPTGNDMVLRWQKAREMFAQGNTSEAANLYEALTTDFPANADLHGETGNLYYNLGQFGKAASHYQKVGEISARNGNMQMAQAMMAVLLRISPGKAGELQTFINARQ